MKAMRLKGLLYGFERKSTLIHIHSISLRRILLSPTVEKVGKESADCSTHLPTCDSNPKRQKLPTVKQLAVFNGFFIVWVPSCVADVGI